MANTNELAAKAHRKFGRITYEYFGGGSWRAWAQNWHYLDGAIGGSVSAHGATIDEALTRLLSMAKRYAHVAEGSALHCSYCRQRDCD